MKRTGADQTKINNTTERQAKDMKGISQKTGMKSISMRNA